MQASIKNIFFVLLLVPHLLSAADEAPAMSFGENCSIADTARISDSSVGDGCSIDHYSIIKRCVIGNNVKIHPHCVLTNVTIQDGAEIGPFAHLHDGSIIGNKAVIGNFVEVTRSIVGKESKAKHLSYLGDAELGEKVNIGAGTITCNYDGVNKNKTVIKDNAKIGSNSCLVAPIAIGENAITGAGSTLTQDVPDGALAIERGPQTNKEGYASKLLQKYHDKKNANTNKTP